MADLVDLTLSALQADGFSRSPAYEAALAGAVHEVEPLFGRAVYGRVFRDAAVHPEWMAVSLMANAEREGDGAGRLWSLAGCTSDDHLVSELKTHAIDESMHSRAYVAMLDLVFPDCADPTLRQALIGCSPGYGEQDTPTPVEGSPYAHAVTIDDLVQMNIAEIRTRIHHLLQRPMLFAHCPQDRIPALTQILDRLLRDETRHVGYTAQLIESHAQAFGPEEVVELMRRRLADFDDITEHELGRRIFD